MNFEVSNNKTSAGNLISMKAAFIIILILLLMLPLLIANRTIYTRQVRHDAAVKEIAQSWSNPQQISGPVLDLPYVHGNQTKTISCLPEMLEISANVEPELRYRGLYETVVYKSKLNIKGLFRLPKGEITKDIKLDSKTVFLYSLAEISLGISDVRRLKAGITARFNGRDIIFKPGSANFELLASGIHAGGLGLEKLSDESLIPFSMQLSLDGSGSINFLPFAKNNILQIKSSWPHPSFVGAYLPDARNISANGFDASYEISYFGRSYPQVFTHDQLTPEFMKAIQHSSYGINFIQPVNIYRQSERSVKYGIIFIVFTFMVYFLFEIVSKIRIHLFQYGLVGVALCTFFLLLTSLSEHIGFAHAYFVATILVIAQISLYSLSIIKTIRKSAIITFVLAILYLYLYLVLQMEDYALIIGSLGLFIALSAVMVAVRKVEWFGRSELKAEKGLE